MSSYMQRKVWCKLHCFIIFSLLENKVSDSRVREIIFNAVEIEREFVCKALSCYLVEMNSKLMSTYIEFVADRLMVSNLIWFLWLVSFDLWKYDWILVVCHSFVVGCLIQCPKSLWLDGAYISTVSLWPSCSLRSMHWLRFKRSFNCEIWIGSLGMIS